MRFLIVVLSLLTMTGCGIVYHSPDVDTIARNGNKVRVVPMNGESIMVANRAAYSPQALPAIFSQSAGTGNGLRTAGPAPDAVFDPTQKPAETVMRVPPAVDPGPYRIGVSDVLLLAVSQTGGSVEQLSGLLAAQNARQGYTVQDDGAIAIPNVGRVQLVGLTLDEAEARLFQRLVENQIDPTFSLEVAEFNSQKVSVGGAVAQPRIENITLTPLYLDEALTAAGGIRVDDMDYATVRIYRDGTLYQIPVNELYSSERLQKIQLIDGDSVFVDTTYDLDLAQSYFAEQIRLAEFSQGSRSVALSQLNTEIGIRRSELQEQRQNFQTQLSLGAVDRDYVYLTGEVNAQSRYALPFNNSASLADALYDQGEGVPTRTGNVRQIYVLRASQDPREMSAVTAWWLDATNAANFVLATRFELRPNDVIFVAEQPVTRWNRVVQQLIPSLVNNTANTLLE